MHKGDPFNLNGICSVTQYVFVYMNVRFAPTTNFYGKGLLFKVICFSFEKKNVSSLKTRQKSIGNELLWNEIQFLIEIYFWGNQMTFK